MTWSYSGDPSDSDLDAVRFLVQDIDTSNQLVQNEEITYMLTARGSVPSAAIAIASAIAAQLSRETVSVAGALQYREYQMLIARLRSDLAVTANAYTGGSSVSKKDEFEDDTDRVVPAFSKELFGWEALDTADDEC